MLWKHWEWLLPKSSGSDLELSLNFPIWCCFLSQFSSIHRTLTKAVWSFGILKELLFDLTYLSIAVLRVLLTFLMWVFDMYWNFKRISFYVFHCDIWIKLYNILNFSLTLGLGLSSFIFLINVSFCIVFTTLNTLGFNCLIFWTELNSIACILKFSFYFNLVYI